MAGSEFQMLLDHARSPKPGLNESVVSGVIDQRVRSALVTIVSASTELCRQKLGEPVPILVHGYDYAVADGRGFLCGWGPLPGPWLEPGFRQKGYASIQDRLAIVREMIDRFNAMLLSVASLPEFKHVKYVDLRQTLSSGADYKDWWADELHPSRQGFAAVAGRIAARL